MTRTIIGSAERSQFRGGSFEESKTYDKGPIRAERVSTLCRTSPFCRSIPSKATKSWTHSTLEERPQIVAPNEANFEADVHP